MANQCKKCGAELGGQFSEVEESGELVIVDKQTEQPLVLNQGDKLCTNCSGGVIYYRRVPGQYE